MKLFEEFESLPKWLLYLISIFLVFVIGILDFYTGKEISFSIFYLLPIFFVFWIEKPMFGLFISFLSTGSWLAAELIPGHNYSHDLIPYWNAFVRLGFFLIFSYILSSLKKALNIEKIVARKDFLTGIGNIKAFYEVVNNLSQQYNKKRLTLNIIYFDCDDFKKINDTYGHKEGNILLTYVAQTLKRNIRHYDFAARFGGDEFILLMPGIEHTTAVKAVQRIRKNLMLAMKKYKWSVTFSIGLATYLSPLPAIDEMIKNADDLMYLAKKAGKNRIKSKIFFKTNRK